MSKVLRDSFIVGMLGTAALLALYVSVVTAISGWDFARAQFSAFWYFIVALAIGFGIQAGLYRYLRGRIRQGNNAGKVLVAAGANSTVAMISCCAHYLINVLPVLGATGFLALIGQYQVKLFWFGLVANLLGITYISSKIIQFSRHA